MFLVLVEAEIERESTAERGLLGRRAFTRPIGIGSSVVFWWLEGSIWEGGNWMYYAQSTRWEPRPVAPGGM